jgi:hypothetical protein
VTGTVRVRVRERVSCEAFPRGSLKGLRCCAGLRCSPKPLSTVKHFLRGSFKRCAAVPGPTRSTMTTNPSTYAHDPMNSGTTTMVVGPPMTIPRPVVVYWDSAAPPSSTGPFQYGTCSAGFARDCSAGRRRFACQFTAKWASSARGIDVAARL